MPSHHRYETRNDSKNPGECDHHQAHLQLKILMVENRKFDGHEPFNGDGDQIEHGDTGEAHDHAVHKQASIEVRWKLEVVDDDKRNSYDANTCVRHGQAADEIVGGAVEGLVLDDDE